MSTKARKSDPDLLQLAKKAQAMEIAGRYSHVLELGQQMTKAKPEWSIGHYFVGSAQCGLGMLDEANRTLQRAIKRDDKRAGFFVRRAEVLNRLGHRDEASLCTTRAIELDPDNPDILVPSAMVQWLGGDPVGAHALLTDAIVRDADSPKLRSVHALVCAEVGRLDEGIEALHALLAEHNDGQGLPRLLHSECRMYLAKLLDKAGRFDDAFEHARLGGALRESRYKPQTSSSICNDRLAAWSTDRFDSIPTSRSKSESPVFIIGMPRSGTSLVEQIIASHPLAYGSGELLDAWHACKEISEPDELFPDRTSKVDQLKPPILDRCARKVLKVMEKAATREKGNGVLRVTDKLPNNFELVGIIHKVFPNARFIHCNRNPLDTCISCFLLDFVGDHNHGYSYNLHHLADQYRIYKRYMAHWRSIESIPMHEVQYEDLIENPEQGAREIIDFIGLEWDDACAMSHETKRAVSTLSSDQVRKPMYTSSKERWRNYEEHIGVLINALGTGEG